MVIDWDTYQFSLKEENEDICYADASMAWVLDGASGLYNSVISDHKSDAAWFVKQIDAYLKAHLQETMPIATILQHALIEIKQTFMQFPNAQHVKDYPSCAAAIVRSSEHTMEYYVMADCELLIKKQDGSICKITDQRVSKFDNRALQAAIDEAQRTLKSVDECQSVMKPMKVQNRKLKNKENGYYALSDDAHICDQGLVGKIDLRDISSICLCSDGFAQYYQTMKVVHDEAEFFQSLETKSLADMHQEMYDKQVEDAHLTLYPRFKLTDDNTILYGNIKKDL